MAGLGGGRPAMPPGRSDPKTNLPTFIYDYFLKKGKLDLARAIYESDMGVNTRPRIKTSPGAREVNGIDDSTAIDSKDQLPPADLMDHLQDASFLQEWWCVFWDLYNASRKNGSGPSSQYYRHSENQRMQRDSILQMAARPNVNQMNPALRGMMPNGMMNGMAAAGMNQGDMRRGAIANSNRSMMQMPQVRNVPGQQQMGQTPMQREGSDTERPQSPMSGDNAPSPKRQRIDGSAMGTPANRGPMPNGPGQTPNMMQNGGGFDPTSMPGGAFNSMASGPGQKNMQALAGRLGSGMNLSSEAVLARGLATPGGMNGSPMMPSGPDGFNMPELFNHQNGALGPRAINSNPNQQGGALADYQMQLMLLEQQNKKRLIMARQEQEAPQGPGGVASVGNQAMMAGQAHFPPAQGMSPRGSRNGNSPSPNDQIKRGTPNMAQASPRPDGSGAVTRGSPAPGMDPSQMGPTMQANHFFNMNRMNAEGMMMQNGARPPGPAFNGPNGPMSQAQMEIIRRQGAPQMGAGNWGPQGAQMPGQNMPQMAQQGQSENQPRSNMPPPQMPAGAPNAGRTNPSSPSQTPAPPTPSQNKGANSKAKKDSKDTKKKPPKKGASTTGATPNSEAGNPPTPPPKTPTTPTAPTPWGKANAGPAQANQPQPPNGAQPQPNGQQAPPAVPPQPDNNTTGQPFGPLDGAENLQDFQLGDFNANMETSDVLEGFDFDTFLHNMDGPNQELDFGFGNMGGMGDVEMGANEG